jgi:hypothetical protein
LGEADDTCQKQNDRQEPEHSHTKPLLFKNGSDFRLPQSVWASLATAAVRLEFRSTVQH